MYYIKMFQDKEAPGLSWKDRNSDMSFGKKFYLDPHLTLYININSDKLTNLKFLKRVKPQKIYKTDEYLSDLGIGQDCLGSNTMEQITEKQKD